MRQPWKELPHDASARATADRRLPEVRHALPTAAARGAIALSAVLALRRIAELGAQDQRQRRFTLLERAFGRAAVVGDVISVVTVLEIRKQKAVAAHDASRDLALVKLDSPPAQMKPVPLAEALPKPGDALHAMSHPGGLEFAWVYSNGTVRQRGRRLTSGIPCGPALEPQS